MKSINDEAGDGARAGQGRKAGLRDLDIRRAKPAAQPYRMNDGRGLFLWVTPTDRKAWRTYYTIDGVKHLLTLGEYPAMSLADARAARANIRTQVRDGANPTHERRIARRGRLDRGAQTFRAMATEWHAVQARTAWAPGYAREVLRRFEVDVFPLIGERPISAIGRDDIIRLLERKLLGDGGRAGSRAAAVNLRQNLQSVFESWVDRELIERNPAAKLAKRFPGDDRAPQPAVLTIEGARAVLAAIEGSGATLALRLLNRFQALTCVRPSEAREARWSEFDRPGVWRIPAERMKGRRGRKNGHDVPLSRQAQEVLDVAREVLGGNGSPFVFPAVHRGTHAPLGASSLSERMLAILPADLKHVPHGWRATFSTIMNELHPNEDRVMDAMLAHSSKGAVERRYNRSTHAKIAAVRIQEWADLLLADAPDAWTMAGLRPSDVITFERPALVEGIAA
jgi:integrase